MKKTSLVFLTLLIACLSTLKTNAQQSSPAGMCLCPTSKPRKKIDANLNDYYEVQICNSSKKRIIGVEFGKLDPSVMGVFPFRTKVSVEPNTKKIVKIPSNGFTSYTNEALEENWVGVTKLIFEDGSLLEVKIDFFCPNPSFL